MEGQLNAERPQVANPILAPLKSEQIDKLPVPNLVYIGSSQL